MSNSASKGQCKRKRVMREEEQKFGPLTYIGMCADPHYATFNKASWEFSRGPDRRGNARHAKAKEKVDKRRLERSRANREVKKQLRDEE